MDGVGDEYRSGSVGTARVFENNGVADKGGDLSMKQDYIQSIETALRLLEAEGFITIDLWREWEKRKTAVELGKPSDEDCRYTLPTVPPAIANHLLDGVKEELRPEVLWKGYSYSLTPGQRALLLDTYGLTPSMTITVAEVETWPGTQHPRAMTLVSDIHIDPRRRRHVLTQCVINEVGKFFMTAQEIDSREITPPKKELCNEWMEVGRIVKLDQNDKWAVSDLSGVEFKPRGGVEIVFLSKEKFTLVDLQTGTKATVPRDEFFKLVDEYEVLHREKTPRKARAVEATPMLDELLKSMGIL